MTTPTFSCFKRKGDNYTIINNKTTQCVFKNDEEIKMIEKYINKFNEEELTKEYNNKYKILKNFKPSIQGNRFKIKCYETYLDDLKKLIQHLKQGKPQVQQLFKKENGETFLNPIVTQILDVNDALTLKNIVNETGDPDFDTLLKNLRLWSSNEPNPSKKDILDRLAKIVEEKWSKYKEEQRLRQKEENKKEFEKYTSFLTSKVTENNSNEQIQSTNTNNEYDDIRMEENSNDDYIQEFTENNSFQENTEENIKNLEKNMNNNYNNNNTMFTQIQNPNQSYPPLQQQQQQQSQFVNNNVNNSPPMNKTAEINKIAQDMFNTSESLILAEFRRQKSNDFNNNSSPQAQIVYYFVIQLVNELKKRLEESRKNSNYKSVNEAAMFFCVSIEIGLKIMKTVFRTINENRDNMSLTKDEFIVKLYLDWFTMLKYQIYRKFMLDPTYYIFELRLRTMFDYIAKNIETFLQRLEQVMETKFI